MAPRGRLFDDDETLYGKMDGEYCDVCKQEYTDHCPIRSSKCPFEGGGESEEEEAEEESDDR